MEDLDNLALKHVLDALPSPKQLAFVLLLCGRLTPALSKFAADTTFDCSFYQKCVHDAWCYLSEKSIPNDYADMADECLNRAPDTEQFDHPLTSAALNAALSVGAMMSFLADYEVDHVLEAAGLARDTAALYAQTTAAIPPHSLSFDEIMSHPLVQQELQRQAEDLKFLEAIPVEASHEMASLVTEYSERQPKLLPPEN